jgi:hypothetical protein
MDERLFGLLLEIFALVKGLNLFFRIEGIKTGKGLP